MEQSLWSFSRNEKFPSIFFSFSCRYSLITCFEPLSRGQPKVKALKSRNSHTPGLGLLGLDVKQNLIGSMKQDSCLFFSSTHSTGFSSHYFWSHSIILCIAYKTTLLTLSTPPPSTSPFNTVSSTSLSTPKIINASVLSLRVLASLGVRNRSCAIFGTYASLFL